MLSSAEISHLNYLKFDRLSQFLGQKLLFNTFKYVLKTRQELLFWDRTNSFMISPRVFKLS